MVAITPLEGILSLVSSTLVAYTAIRVAKIQKGVHRLGGDMKDSRPATTLLERVAQLEVTSDDRWHWQTSAMQTIASTLGVHLPPPPHND